MFNRLRIRYKAENDSTRQEVKDLNVALSVSESTVAEQTVQQPKDDVYDELINKADGRVVSV